MNSQMPDTITLPNVAEDGSVTDSPTFFGWFNDIKDRLNSQEPWAVDLVIYGLSGFIVGFLLKNIGKMVLLVAAVTAVALLILHYTQIYQLPYEYIESLSRLSSAAALNDALSSAVTFCKEHPVACISGVVGIMVGWKVG